MDIFGVLTMIGGLALFLYGMHVMGDGLAKTSGGKLEQILEKFIQFTDESGAFGRRCDGGDPVVIGNNRYGGWICQLRDHETQSGGWHYYGSQYRYHGDIMAA